MYNLIKKVIAVSSAAALMLGGIVLGQFRNMQKPEPTIDFSSNKAATTQNLEKNNQYLEKSMKEEEKAFAKLCNNGGTILPGGMGCKCADGYQRDDVKGCQDCNDDGVCCGIELNTDVPFIGNCIELSNGTEENTDNTETRVTEQTAFPVLMGGLTKMMVTIIMLVSFVAILVGGVMIASSGGSDSGASNGKKLIGRVIVALALLGASGVILRLINPNFFG